MLAGVAAHTFAALALQRLVLGVCLGGALVAWQGLGELLGGFVWAWMKRVPAMWS